MVCPKENSTPERRIPDGFMASKKSGQNGRSFCRLTVFPPIWRVYPDMKIHQIICAGILLTMLLTACAPEWDATVTTTESTELTSVEPVATTTVPPTGSDDPITVPVGGIGEKSERFEIKQGNRTLLSVSLALPVASITGNESLQATLTERLGEREAEIRDYAERLGEKYRADSAAGKDALAMPALQVRFSLNYFTSEAISLTYFYNETTSEGRTVSYARFTNIDLRVGSEILLSALLNEGASDTLVTKVHQAVEASGADGLYEGQKTLITDLMNSRWYMTRDSLVFCFSPGDLAPVSSGQITVNLDKETLADLLSSYGSALIG